jgi:hypothetical protein
MKKLCVLVWSFIGLLRTNTQFANGSSWEAAIFSWGHIWFDCCQNHNHWQCCEALVGSSLVYGLLLHITSVSWFVYKIHSNIGVVLNQLSTTIGFTLHKYRLSVQFSLQKHYFVIKVYEIYEFSLKRLNNKIKLTNFIYFTYHLLYLYSL